MSAAWEFVPVGKEADVLAEFLALCREHALVGVALCDVLDGLREAPEGWILHPGTCFYLPPNYHGGPEARQ